MPLTLLIRMFVTPVPVTLLLVPRSLAEYMNPDVVLVEEDTVTALFVVVPAVVVFVISVVVPV